MALIDDAVARAAADHVDQTDAVIGGPGNPILYHLMRVGIAVFTETGDEEMAAVAVMQRLYSDTATTDADLEAAGWSARVRGGITILTQGGAETRKAYIKRIGNDDPDAIHIKIIELREAIRSLGLSTNVRDKSQKAMRYLQEQLMIETIDD